MIKQSQSSVQFNGQTFKFVDTTGATAIHRAFRTVPTLDGHYYVWDFETNQTNKVAYKVST